MNTYEESGSCTADVTAAVDCSYKTDEKYCRTLPQDKGFEIYIIERAGHGFSGADDETATERLKSLHNSDKQNQEGYAPPVFAVK